MTEYHHALPPLPNPHQRTVATSPLLSTSECEALLALTERRSGWADASVSRPGVTDGIVDREVRSADLFPLPTDGGWPFNRLVEAIAEHNSATYRFDLDGIYESDRPAVARYTSGEFGTDYSGGDLFFSDLGVAAPRDRGTLVLFPSMLTHVVTPVVEGTRRVIVGWVHGPATT